MLEDGVLRPEGALWASMADARAICFGELHPNAEHHLAQSRALTELARRAEADGRVLGVGFEMFQRPFQAALDAFVAGQIDEEELLLDTEYEARWGGLSSSTARSLRPRASTGCLFSRSMLRPSSREKSPVWASRAWAPKNEISVAGPDAQLIIFAGMGHCQESAIPERITRRTSIDVLNIMPLENAELQLLGAAPSMFDMIVLLGF